MSLILFSQIAKRPAIYLACFMAFFCINGLAQTKVLGQAQHGRFVVESLSDGSLRVVGGVYTPAQMPLTVTTDNRFVVIVNTKLKSLELFEQKQQDQFVPIIGYAVVTPKSESLPRSVVFGQVRFIDTSPTWCPTAGVRKQNPELAPGCYPFGHPDNAMGVMKWMIDWEVSPKEKAHWSTIRVHGASGYPERFFDEETTGCTRLNNDELLMMVQKMTGTKTLSEATLQRLVSKGVLVIFWRG